MLRLLLGFLLLLTLPVWAAPASVKPLIVIDPGHGGKDLGTHCKLYKEKELTLIMSKMVGSVLQKLGYRVLYTRANDVFVALDERAAFANNEGADLFVSIHFNSAPNSQAHGIEVYFYDIPSEKKSRLPQSKKLAKAALDNSVAATEGHSRGVRHGNFAVIRETQMPAILIECGFLTNPEERAKLLDKNYLRKMARGLAHVVHRYCQAEK